MFPQPRDPNGADIPYGPYDKSLVEESNVPEKAIMRSGHSKQDLPPVPPKPMRLWGRSINAKETDESSRKDHSSAQPQQEDCREHQVPFERDLKPSKACVCQTCNARFRRLYDLKRHTKLHTGERPHTCDKCGRRFARGDFLARHNEGPGGCAGARRSSGGNEDDFLGPSLIAGAKARELNLKDTTPRKTSLERPRRTSRMDIEDESSDGSESDDKLSFWTSPSSTRSGSITSIESISNGQIQSGRLARITRSLHDDATLQVIAENARNESALRSEKYQKRLSEMVVAFGKELASEAQAPNERSAAKAMQSSFVSSWTADHLIPRGSPQSYHAGPEGRRSVTLTNYGSPTRLNDASLDAETDADDAQLSPEDIIIRDFVAGSHAFINWKASLLDFIHEPQEEAIRVCITGTTVGESGSVLSGEAIAAIAKEISWIPPERLTIGREVHIALPDKVKGLIEDTMRETWDWWPLPPRQRTLRQGFCRVRWRSPGGEPHHIDIIEEKGEALARVIDHASVFVKKSFQHHSWDEPSPCNEGKDGSSIGNVLAAVQRITRMMASPFASTSDTETIAQESFSGSSQATDGQPSTTDTGSRLPSQPSTAPTDKKSPVQGQGARATGTPSANNSRGSRNVQSDRSRGVQPSNSALNRSRHVYICVKSGSHCFCHLSCTSVKTDLDFFASLKTEYLRRRGRMRLWFSMWRYDHCEFYRFHKYGYEVGEPVKIAFPDASDTTYDFEPRPPLDSPPHGPITEGEFRDHFYKDCGTYHSWRRYRREKIFSHLNNEAVKSLPKRIQELEMQDGKREYFYGLYAKERRSAFRVMVYAALCNVPGTLFFFLWLFQWEHASDLQNASVPVMLSLSLTLGFVMLVYESRERR